jgi:hypothetical protein
LIRHRKWCARSWRVGFSNDATRTPKGLRPRRTCLITPSFPQVSMPCRIGRTRRLFSDFPWASNRDCNSADDPAFAAKMTPDATYRYRRHERFSPTRACGWGFS